MVTKGIVSSTEIDTNRTLGAYGTQRYHELALKGMMISCFTYGNIERDSYVFNKYVEPYRKELGEEVFNEVYEEMRQHFESCKVDTCVYTDEEGCTYNNLIEPNV